MTKLTPKYSGPESKKFWERIYKIKDKHKQSEAYSIGVILQNHEETAIKIINCLL